MDSCGKDGIFTQYTGKKKIKRICAGSFFVQAVVVLSAPVVSLQGPVILLGNGNRRGGFEENPGAQVVPANYIFLPLQTSVTKQNTLDRRCDPASVKI